MNNIIWIVAAVVFAAVEALTFNLVTIWFAIGALVAFAVSYFGADVTAQLWIFVLVSVVSLALTKPLVAKKLNVRRQSTNADMIIGKTAVVTTDIKRDSFGGEIKVCGRPWSATAFDGGDIPAGCDVVVERIDGVRAVVRRLDENKSEII